VITKEFFTSRPLLIARIFKETRVLRPQKHALGKTENEQKKVSRNKFVLICTQRKGREESETERINKMMIRKRERSDESC